MSEIKCPNCGKIFTVKEEDYNSIINQIKNKEFEIELNNRIEQLNKKMQSDIDIVKLNKDKEYSDKIQELNNTITKLKNDIELKNMNSELLIEKAINEKDKSIIELKNTIELNRSEYEIKEKNLKSSYEEKLSMKDDIILYYKDLKLKQSTKMIGENLEVHCNNEFNKLRGLFKDAYFEKDNDIKTGSKGDFIYRDYIDGVEFISIMFEMKNEMDTTSTKHKNEDFFKELDKDRREKKCEYAILVSLLEKDNDLYNEGIVDVSHKYDKMYVIRPQFFIPIITLLRNAAKNSLEYKKELMLVQNQNIDISNFEEKINTFKEGFNRNYKLASEKFQTAIEEIDKTIAHLMKTKDALISSENNLRLANNKAEDLTIKKLTNNNETLKKMFEEEKNNE